MSDDEISSREVLQRYQAGERIFRELDIEDPPDDRPLRGQKLDGIDFAGSFLLVDFTGASLRGAVFRANVKCCWFDQADLTGADFRGAAMESATFRGAKVDGACFEGAGIFSHIFGPDELPDLD
jgi:pentapeptide repeat protein